MSRSEDKAVTYKAGSSVWVVPVSPEYRAAFPGSAWLTTAQAVVLTEDFDGHSATVHVVADDGSSRWLDTFCIDVRQTRKIVSK